MGLEDRSRLSWPENDSRNGSETGRAARLRTGGIGVCDPPRQVCSRRRVAITVERLAIQAKQCLFGRTYETGGPARRPWFVRRRGTCQRASIKLYNRRTLYPSRLAAATAIKTSRLSSHGPTPNLGMCRYDLANFKLPWRVGSQAISLHARLARSRRLPSSFAELIGRATPLSKEIRSGKKWNAQCTGSFCVSTRQTARR